MKVESGTAWQDEALARDGVSREVPCSALKGETVPDSLPALERHPQLSLATRGEDWASQGQPKGLTACCLENPRDREAWWAAIYGVAQSRTRLKRLSI